MQTSADLDRFYDSSSYKDVLETAAASVGRSISEEFPEILYGHDQKKLTCAHATIASLERILENSPRQLCNFVKIKWEGSVWDSIDGVFPPGEELGQDETARVVKELPLYRNFLLPYLIEWDLLTDRPTVLPGYIKCVRMPHAAKYEKNLKLWYSKALSKG